MPLCPQITNTPITVTLTADFTVTDVIPVLPADTEQLDGVVVLIDGKTKAYYQTTEPTTGMTEGDLWFDTDDGFKLYFYTGSAWTSVQDTSIAAAQSAATAAQTTADGKNKVYRQTTQPSTGPFAEGDLWFDTDDDNKIYRYTAGSWGTAVTLGNNALASISANKITAGTIDASVITVSNINAGNISTGTLAAARIAAGSLDASKITAGTITGTQISAGYVYAGTIAAGNITTGTLSATVALSAVSGTVGGFNIGSTFLSSGAGGTGFFINSSSGNANFAAISASGSITAGAGLILTTGVSTVSAGGNAFNNVGALSAASVSTSGAISAGTTLTVGGTSLFNGANNSFPNITSSTSAANVRWGTTGGGRIFESTASSARFKENIVDLDTVYDLYPKKLLQLPVRAFSYKPEYLGSGDERAECMVPGFIAEEVDQVYTIAADFEKGLPNNWNEKFIIPGMLWLIQDLYKEIAILKGE